MENENKQVEISTAIIWSEPIAETYPDNLSGNSILGTFNGIVIAKITEESLDTVPAGAKQRIRAYYLPFLSISGLGTDFHSSTLDQIRIKAENNFVNFLALMQVSVAGMFRQAPVQESETLIIDNPNLPTAEPTILKKA